MQIQLKQSEIIAALKQYITGQGISLVNKEVTISFTAGRKEAGITADLLIEASSIPGFEDADPEVEADVVVSAPPVLKAVEAVADKVEPDSPPAQEASVVKTPTSLFS